MSPAHVFLVSLAVLAVYWLGAATASYSEDNPDVAPCLIIPSFFLNLAAVSFAIVSLVKLINLAL